ncbi:SDR family NAD(P)-dependent oxidoreductase [Psychrobacillus sp. NPDC093180]|uniref:SDR family NAD(P)-dependent oxidoreductase n=1 Tax=Psychrobacillus sp. NPDC093180 TaxID=3364489 RepID=UPI0038308C89
MGNSLSGRIILVTGAANRIGKAIAIAAANEGATIALHYNHSAEQAVITAKEIEQLGSQVACFQSNIANLEDVQKMHKAIQEQLGTVYGVINNAGYGQMKPFFDYEPNEWKQEIDVCLNAVLNLAYTFVSSMKEQEEGKFITIVGDSARTGDRKLIVSAAARNGVISFMKSLAQEVGRQQIQCNTVSLGLIDQDDLQMGEDIYRKVVKGYPLHRLGKPEDITGMMKFLLSDQSDWITGQVFSINGGHSMLG